jgi:hypothetical protein
MNAPTLTRGRCAPLAGLRPCEVRDPEWWTTGNPGNAAAILLCRTACRFAGECPDRNPNPVGVIVAGTAHNDWGKPIKVCDQCGHPWHQRIAGRPATCMCPRTAADHRATIDTMRRARKSYSQISRATGLTRATIRNYVTDQAIRQKAALLGTQIRPAEHHEQIEAMRRDGVAWADVATTIGCTHNALMGYVKRQRDRGLIAA